MIEAVCVDPEKLEFVWPRIRHIIKAAYDKQPCDDTFEEVSVRLHRGDCLLWVAWDGCEIYGAVVTELWKNPARKVCAILALGGKDWRKWKHCIAAIEKFAKDEGCDAVRFAGRKAWLRLMPEYRQPWITLEKQL